MRWRLKARIQRTACLLPASFSYSAYYWIQRHFGSLRSIRPMGHLRAGLDVCDRIVRAGRSPIGGAFLEVGTGRRIGMPLAFWLLGASRVTTVDVNPYLREELVREDVDYMRENPDEVEGMFRTRIHDDRLNKLLDFTSNSWRLAGLLAFCGIEYVAPGNAAQLGAPPNSYDFHTSFYVLEHIPQGTLKAILMEGKRLLQRGGIFVHCIDFSDHFSDSDRSISKINFLQFGAEEWHKIAGNRYMYMNRLRVDDFCGLFQGIDLRIHFVDAGRDPSVLEILKSGRMELDAQFLGKPEQVLATTGAWIVAGMPG
jgi:SAM-dependent methyltransferase